MEIYREKGVYGEGDVYILKSIEDFDEYEKILSEKEDGYIKNMIRTFIPSGMISKNT